MHSLLSLGTLTLFHFGSFTAAHESPDDIPLPQIFGGQDAMRQLPRHMIEDLHESHEKKHERRDWSTPNVASNKKCGPGLGYCDQGDW